MIYQGHIVVASIRDAFRHNCGRSCAALLNSSWRCWYCATVSWLAGQSNCGSLVSFRMSSSTEIIEINKELEEVERSNILSVTLYNVAHILKSTFSVKKFQTCINFNPAKKTTRKNLFFFAEILFFNFFKSIVWKGIKA
jgi:hypothetical protein